MKARDIATTMAGMVMLVASATAGVAIRLLLTSPTTVATAMDGREGGPLHAIARVLYEAMWDLVRSL
jgi:hypothetical protein